VIEAVEEEAEVEVVVASAEAAEEDTTPLLVCLLVFKSFSSRELGQFMHKCETEMLFKATQSGVPKFNRMVFNSSDNNSKKEVGSVNEILGKFNEYVFSL